MENKVEKKPGAFSGGINWDNIKVYKPGDEPSPFGVKVDYDPEVEKMNQSFEEDFAKAQLESQIEQAPEQVISNPGMPEEAKTEAAQVLDGDKRTDEANNDKVEAAVEKLSEDFDTVDDLAAYLDQVDDEGNPFFPEDKENPDAVWNQYENPAEAYRNYVEPEDEEKWAAYQKSKEEAQQPEDGQVVEQAELDVQKAMKNPVEAAKAVLNEDVAAGNASDLAIGGGSGTEGLELDTDTRGTPGGSFSHAIKNLGTGSGQSNAASVSAPKNKPVAVESVSSRAGTGSPDTVKVEGTRNTSNSNGYVTSNGGSYNSGGVNHTGSSLKAQKTSLPGGESKNQAALADVNLADAAIQSIETRIREIPEGLASSLGFKIGANVSYNDTPIADCTPEMLNDIEKILTTLGV